MDEAQNGRGQGTPTPLYLVRTGNGGPFVFRALRMSMSGTDQESLTNHAVEMLYGSWATFFFHR
jgi:hypothetical protein